MLRLGQNLVQGWTVSGQVLQCGQFFTRAVSGRVYNMSFWMWDAHVQKKDKLQYTPLSARGNLGVSGVTLHSPVILIDVFLYIYFTDYYYSLKYMCCWDLLRWRAEKCSKASCVDAPSDLSHTVQKSAAGMSPKTHESVSISALPVSSSQGHFFYG